MENSTKWYAVQVRGKKENAAKERLEKEIEICGLDNYFESIYVPMLVTTNKKTKKTEQELLLKGMMFIKCILTSKIEGLIKSQPDIFGFLGGKAQAIPDAQMKRMIKESGCCDVDGKVVDTNNFKVGEEVEIAGTDFHGFKGVITEMNDDNVKVDIKIFNKTVNYEFDKMQIKKQK